jgi:chromosomal replication initiator protein
MTGTLVPELTFGTLILGSRNRFAHAAAVSVAEAPGTAYNPLFIYGGPRLGRTHLLHAVGNYARQLHPLLDIRYVPAKEFGSESVIAAQDSRRGGYRSRHLDAGMLLIGDIQRLPAAEAIQAEFRHVFDTLYDGGKQLVISSDRAPGSLTALDDSLRGRLEPGLLAGFQPAELETRIAILRSKAMQEGFSVPPEVLEYIASRIPADISELEGALIQVAAFASLNGQPVHLQVAQAVLKDLPPQA